MQKKSLLEEHIVYSDIIFAKIFTFGGTQKGVLTLSLQKFLHLEEHKSRF